MIWESLSQEFSLICVCALNFANFIKLFFGINMNSLKYLGEITEGEKEKACGPFPKAHAG